MKDKKKMTVIIAVSAALLIVSAVIFDVISSKKEIEKTDFAMGAVISQKITGRNAVETADEIIS